MVEAEAGVYGFAFRDYDPVDKRWMTEDPIKDGTNWTQYCYSNPVKYIDPLGLAIIDYIGEAVKNGIDAMNSWSNGDSSNQTQTTSSAGSEGSTSSSTNSGGGSTSGGVTSPFYENTHTITSDYQLTDRTITADGVTTTKPHYGTDYSMNSGTKILAPASGVVMFAGDSGDKHGYGNTVIIYHGMDDEGNRIYSQVAHLDSVTVSQWQEVDQGQVTGFSGDTGRSTGPHLHVTVFVISPTDVGSWWNGNRIPFYGTEGDLYVNRTAENTVDPEQFDWGSVNPINSNPNGSLKNNKK